MPSHLAAPVPMAWIDYASCLLLLVAGPSWLAFRRGLAAGLCNLLRGAIHLGMKA